jgi:N-acetylglucosamine PTS system EIICBA or EIICB component
MQKVIEAFKNLGRFLVAFFTQLFGLSKKADDHEFDETARKYIAALGGAENIKEIESCKTRIRLILVSNKELDEETFKELGASKILKAGTQITQIIVGTKAEFLVDAMKKLLPSSVIETMKA